MADADVADEEEEGTEEDDGGAGDTAGAVVVAVLTLGGRGQWRRRGPDPMHAGRRSRGTRCLLGLLSLLSTQKF